MKANKGFTLVELLIALAVFAILATITTSTLYYAFRTRTHVNEEADRLNKIQLAISIIQQDTKQALERPIRGNEMRLFAAFIGQDHYAEFTRDGNVNPDSLEQRSNLLRVAILCQNNNLVRRTWNSLDPIDRNTFEDKILVDRLTDCHFNYLNQNLQTLNEWRENAVTQNQRKESLPTALQVNLVLENWGEINLLFIIAGTHYVAK